jgi:hypothetical protein
MSAACALSASIWLCWRRRWRRRASTVISPPRTISSSPFLEREDLEFWAQWVSVAEQHPNDPAGELDAHMRWIGERLARSNYRGCPQINVAAEFAEQDHPARQVSKRHMQALRSRLQDIAKRLDVRRPNQLAAQLAVLVNGAFVSSALLDSEEATGVLRGALKALLAGARADA